MNGINFKSLLEYYRSCFKLVDVFHFNSSIAKDQFDSALGKICGFVVPITHQSIKDNRTTKRFDSSLLRIGFVGAETPYKGFPLLRKILAQLDHSKWHLDVWGGRVAQDSDLPISYRGKFDNQNLSLVYNDMDLLVVPSTWKETFSLVTLEALSYGVPVLVSDKVGAQDIVKNYDASFVYKTADELKQKINSLIYDRSSLQRYNYAITNSPWKHDMLEHAKDIVEKIYLSI